MQLKRQGCQGEFVFNDTHLALVSVVQESALKTVYLNPTQPASLLAVA